MFVHWAPMVVNATKYVGAEISYSRGGAKPDSWGGGGSIPAQEYDDSYKTFNPTDFDPQAWIAFAQASGMKYITITARHHDGFSLFDSAFTPDSRKITSPDGAYRKWVAQQNPALTSAQVNAKTDIVRQLADAAHAAGMGFGIYYSEPDWVRDDYRIALTGKDAAGRTVSEATRAENREQYLTFMHNQLTELTTKYGRVDSLWFDALKPSQGGDKLWVRPDTVQMIRDNQPGIVINDRTGETPDFETPEQADANYLPGVYQESSHKVGNTWSWHASSGNPSPTWIVERLAINNSRDANLHLNLGPSPAGTFHANEQSAVRDAGAFITSHAAAFFGTRAGTVNDRNDYVTTRAGDKTYLHVLSDALAGQEVAIPGLIATSAKRWDDGSAVSYRIDGDTTYVRVPATINTVDEIVTLTSTPVAPLEAGKVYTLAASHSGKRAGVVDTGSTNGVQATQQASTTSANQRWRADAAGAGFTLTNLATGKCLTVRAGGTADNTVVDQYTCVASKNQVWKAVPTTTGLVNLVAEHSGKCLDVPGASRSDGAGLTQYTCVADAANLQWRLIPQMTFEAGKVYSLAPSHSGKRAGVVDTGSTNGVQATQQAPTTSANQRWRADTAGPGFTLTNVATGKCLTVRAGGSSDSTVVDQYTCVASKNQIWKAVPTTNGLVNLVAEHSGKCLDVPGASQTDGTGLTQYTCVANAANQQWRLTATR